MDCCPCPGQSSRVPTEPSVGPNYRCVGVSMCRCVATLTRPLTFNYRALDNAPCAEHSGRSDAVENTQLPRSQCPILTDFHEVGIGPGPNSAGKSRSTRKSVLMVASAQECAAYSPGQGGRRVAVFCGASDFAPPPLLASAERLGRLLGDQLFDLVYGACTHGSMGSVAAGFVATERDVIGVVPRFLRDREATDALGSQHLVLTDDLFERKRVMMELADAFVVLPGGYGTLDEFAEVLSLSALQDQRHRPLVVVNEAGYFSSLLEFCASITRHRFASRPPHEMFAVVDDVDAAAAYLTGLWQARSHDPQRRPVLVSGVAS